MKRLPESGVIAGVCAGLGAHFGCDAIYFRLAFFLAFVFFGLGVLLYIALAILMQK